MKSPMLEMLEMINNRSGNSLKTKFTEEEKKRFFVRGGLITPDSIDPEPVISWDKEFQYDADYAENLSLKKDLLIFLGVFRILFKRNTSNYGSYVRRPFDLERSERIKSEK